MLEITVTKEEQKAIASLKRLAKKWPDSLCLFSWSGSLTIFKRKHDKYITVDHIAGIKNDGGDPCYGHDIYWNYDYELKYD